MRENWEKKCCFIELELVRIDIFWLLWNFGSVYPRSLTPGPTWQMPNLGRTVDELDFLALVRIA